MEGYALCMPSKSLKGETMIFQVIKKFCRKHATKGLTTVGFLGMGLSCYFTARAWEECKERINQRKEELEKDKLTVKETVAVCWKPFVLPVLTFSTSAGCILWAEKILIKKNAALVALYKASETALAEFKSETRKEVGEETYKKIEQEATKNQAAKNTNYKESGEEIFLDKPLFYDSYKDKFFRSTQSEIQNVFNDIHNRMRDRDSFEEEVSYADLYYDLYHRAGDEIDYFGYYSTDYSYKHPFNVTFGEYYVTAPNGERAIPIFYDHPKRLKKASEY